MCVLISGEELKALTDKYCMLDGSQMPLLIKLLKDIRHLQDDLLLLPTGSSVQAIASASELEQQLCQQIIDIEYPARIEHHPIPERCSQYLIFSPLRLLENIVLDCFRYILNKAILQFW